MARKVRSSLQKNASVLDPSVKEGARGVMELQEFLDYMSAGYREAVEKEKKKVRRKFSRGAR